MRVSKIIYYTIQWNQNETFIANYYGRFNSQRIIFFDTNRLTDCVFFLWFLCNIYLRHFYWHHSLRLTKHSLQYFMGDFFRIFTKSVLMK